MYKQDMTGAFALVIGNEGEGLSRLVDLVVQEVHLPFDVRVVQNDGQVVDAAGHAFEADVVAVQNLQEPVAEAHLPVQVLLGQGDHGEPFAPGDARHQGSWSAWSRSPRCRPG